jgi:predicted transport protein
MESMIRNLQEKTGKPIEQWVGIARKAGSAKHGDIVKHLKSEGLTHGYANLVAHHTLQSASVHADAGDLVESQYSGPKAALRPIYDKLMKRVSAFGNDIEVSPKKAYVSLRRKKQFAIIQPSTATRLDVGINLKDAKPTARLEKSGSFNAMVSHRVRVEKAGEIDDELVGWLKEAYENA